jgi:hypothetical protein
VEQVIKAAQHSTLESKTVSVTRLVAANTIDQRLVELVRTCYQSLYHSLTPPIEQLQDDDGEEDIAHLGGLPSVALKVCKHQLLFAKRISPI